MPQFQLRGTSQAAVMEPIWGLLRSSQNDPEWNPRLRGYLKSVVCNRQCTQTRFKVVCLVEHDRCTLCLQKRIDVTRMKAEAGGDEGSWFVDEVKKAAEGTYATPEAKKAALRKAAEMMICQPQKQLLEGVPKGTPMHRHYQCPRHDVERKLHVTGELARETGDGSHEGYPP